MNGEHLPQVDVTRLRTKNRCYHVGFCSQSTEGHLFQKSQANPASYPTIFFPTFHTEYNILLLIEDLLEFDTIDRYILCA